MRLINLEAVVPGLREARQSERMNRAMAFAGLSVPVLGQECVPLTPRHRLAFQLAGNAFAHGLGERAMEGDVFQFLWALNPAWRRGQPITWAATAAWRKIKATVKRTPLGIQRRAVMEYLAAMLQDLPEGNDRPASHNPATNYVHWMAAELYFYMRACGMSRAQYEAESYLVLQQLYRAHRLDTDDDATFINASDRLVSQWQRQMQKGAGRAN